MSGVLKVCKRKWVHFQGSQLSQNRLPSSYEGFTLKGKNLLPVGAQESKQEVIKVVRLVKMAENLPGLSNHLKKFSLNSRLPEMH